MNSGVVVAQPAPAIEVCGASADPDVFLRRVRDCWPDTGNPLASAEYDQFLRRYYGHSVDISVGRGLEAVIGNYCSATKPACDGCPLRYNCAYARQTRHTSRGALTYADFFAGAGGLSLGLEQAGFVPSVVLDNDYWSTFTYLHNRPRLPAESHVICEDIRTWTRYGALPGIADVVVGGVPCQPFSTANRQRQESDPRDNLFNHLFEAVDILAPQAVLIENVSGFRKVSPEVMESFEEHGFAAKHVLLDASEFGVPQRRRRMFFIGLSRAHFDGAGGMLKGILSDLNDARVSRTVTLEEAIADLPPLEPVTVPNRPGFESDATGMAVRHHDLSSATEYVRDINGGRTETLLFNHKARYNNDRDIEIFSRLRPGEDSTSESIADIMPYASRKHIFKDKYFRLRYDEPCRTITAHMRYDCNMYIHPTQSRGLTAREAARIQGFPDDYVFTGTFQRLYQQVGNAVPVPLARVLGRSLRRALGR